MELINLLSKVVKENVNTKRVLLEYPESTVKKLVDKFSKETEDTEEVIRKNIDTSKPLRVKGKGYIIDGIKGDLLINQFLKYSRD